MSFTESEKSYFHYKFRLVVMEHLKGGKIFGGTVREILKSAACLKEELADKSKFPRSFFVDPDTDIDVFYTDPDRMQEDLVALQTKFFIASSTEKRLSTYGMCLVKSIVLRPSAFSVFGRDGLQIKLDFVEKKDDLSQLFECLSCNNLQTVGTSGIFQLFRPFSHQQSADDFLELIDAMNASMFRMKETRWLLLRHDFFDQMSMPTATQCPRILKSCRNPTSRSRWLAMVPTCVDNSFVYNTCSSRVGESPTFVMESPYESTTAVQSMQKVLVVRNGPMSSFRIASISVRPGTSMAAWHSTQCP